MTGTNSDFSVIVPPAPIDQTKCDWKLRIGKADFASLLPYHFVVDRDCRLIQFGNAL